MLPNHGNFSPVPRRAFHARLSFIVLLALGAAALLFAMPALPQDVQYHMTRAMQK
jgi:hypothetical protein